MTADRTDGHGEMFGTAILQIIAVNAGHDDMFTAQFGHRISPPARPERAGRARLAGGGVADAAFWPNVAWCFRA